jgi:hypothetical protein
MAGWVQAKTIIKKKGNVRDSISKGFGWTYAGKLPKVSTAAPLQCLL